MALYAVCPVTQMRGGSFYGNTNNAGSWESTVLLSIQAEAVSQVDRGGGWMDSHGLCAVGTPRPKDDENRGDPRIQSLGSGTRRSRQALRLKAERCVSGEEVCRAINIPLTRRL